MKNVWWENMAGPADYIRRITESLLKNGKCIAYIPKDVPYRDEMRKITDEKIHDEAFDVCVDFVSGSDVDLSKPGKFILDQYSQRNEKNAYRSNSGKSIQSYIQEKRILKNRVLWLCELTEDQEKIWMSFIEEYNSSDARNGAFVLEIKNNPRKNAIELLDYTKAITRYDYLTYGSLLSSQFLKGSDEYKQYIATLSSMVYENRIDLTERFVKEASFRFEDLFALIQEINTGSNYVPRELDKKVWKAQLQVLFPMLEEERKSFIDKYYDQIQTGLMDSYDKKGSPAKILQFNEQITDPYEAELGTLHKMTTVRRYKQKNSYVLYIANEHDKERLELIWKMRNGLAHRLMCKDSDVKDFLDFYPYFY